MCVRKRACLINVRCDVGLSELPEELRQLVSLSTLILDHNLIKEIPMSLCILGTLKKLVWMCVFFLYVDSSHSEGLF
jgi:Leucine-rich repeat (LRR) protein